MDDPFVDPPQDNPLSDSQERDGLSSGHRQGFSDSSYPVWPLMNEGPQMRYDGWRRRAVPAVSHWQGTHTSWGPNLYPLGNNSQGGSGGPPQQNGAFSSMPSVTMPIPPPKTAKRPAPEDSPARSAEDKFARMRNKRRKTMVCCPLRVVTTVSSLIQLRTQDLKESLETEIGQNFLLRRENEQLKHENAHHKAFIESGTSEVARLLQEISSLKGHISFLLTEPDRQEEQGQMPDLHFLQDILQRGTPKAKEKAKMKALQKEAVVKIEAVKENTRKQIEAVKENARREIEAMREALAKQEQEHAGL